MKKPHIRNYGTRAVAFAAILLANVAMPAHAEEYMTVETVTYEWVEEEYEDSANLADSSVSFKSDSYSDTYDTPTYTSADTIESFGPFHVTDNNTVTLNGDISSNAPALFSALIRKYPSINKMVMVDCPGTNDDDANLSLARMIRKAGIATHVPAGGSIRSGGVELFLAGISRSAHPTAEFAVHSWQDEDGYQASDYAANDPVHQNYLKYYREMGLSADKAKSFYAMTNSVPFEDALYLNTRQIANYVPLN